ncbi:hypothetical protein L2E82_29660 [Cichorium intybus]|uniref:Uncharacterized protein n=1 Tax=Cichorium intybus TaxID=13427 RepID=A0ACB9CYD1_CICIN|nr:hypothetical protein L2E82_29660 [Cichorium intybus]
MCIHCSCIFVFSAFAAWATYLLTKGAGAGLTAAVLLAMVPSYIYRSVAGSYDNEAVAIFALIFTFYLYIKVVLGILLAALVPVDGFNAVMTSEHFASFLESLQREFLCKSCFPN